jgi:hypothetical protein
MTFLQLYGSKLSRELGSVDTTQLFTTVLRKEYVNEGQQKFNEQASCYIKRDEIALTDGDGEYDIEVETTDYMWPAKVGASIARTITATSAVSYLEGDDFQFTTEEELNANYPGWRSHSAGTPIFWGFRADTSALNVFLYPAPDIPATETWALLWPYVAQPADMTDDSHEPYGNATPRTTLRPYHDAILHYAAAQCEKLRKNWDGVERQTKMFAAYVARYRADQQPKRGSRMRFAHSYALSRVPQVRDPRRYP